jgi:hypothetical protein
MSKHFIFLLQVKTNPYLFATVPNSRIISWESWLFLTCRKINNQAGKKYSQWRKKNNNNHERNNQAWANILQAVHNIIIFLLFIWITLSYTLYKLGRLLSWSTSWLHPSWPHPWVRLSLLPTLFHMYLLCLFWPTQYLAVRSNDSCFTSAPSLDK